MTRPQILFVDDEPGVLDGLRRMLWRQGQSWGLYWAHDAADALDLLQRQPMDILVTDMKMPGMDGAALLEQVRALYPQTARLVLSGHADHDAIIAAAGPAQRYLAKPCRADALTAALASALRAMHLMDDPELRALVGGLKNLPKPPQIYHEFTELIARPNMTTRAVARLIERDVSMTTEVLKLMNSSFFGLATEVTTIERAVTLLGLDALEALVLAGSVFAPTRSLPQGIDAGAIAERGVKSCFTARSIGQLEGWGRTCVNHVGLAALLHDVGLLVLASAYPDRFERYRTAAPDLPQRQRETEAFGCTIGELSAYLLELWAFPEQVVTALAMQPLDLDDLVQRTAGGPPALVVAVSRALIGPGPLVLTPDEGGGYLHERRLARWMSPDGELPAESEQGEQLPGAEAGQPG